MPTEEQLARPRLRRGWKPVHRQPEDGHVLGSVIASFRELRGILRDSSSDCFRVLNRLKAFFRHLRAIEEAEFLSEASLVLVDVCWTSHTGFKTVPVPVTGPPSVSTVISCWTAIPRPPCPESARSPSALCICASRSAYRRARRFLSSSVWGVGSIVVTGFIGSLATVGTPGGYPGAVAELVRQMAMFLASTLGLGVPYAIAGKFRQEHPRRTVVSAVLAATVLFILFIVVAVAVQSGRLRFHQRRTTGTPILSRRPSHTERL